MYNPSYLIRSRHAIYYFRYPVPYYPSSRISISLKTRCPKEALRLAKALEYLAIMFTNEAQIQGLGHAEIKERLKQHFLDALDQMKRQIDRDGALSAHAVQGYKIERDEAIDFVQSMQGALENDQANDETLTVGLGLDGEEIERIAKKFGISTDRKSAEYNRLYHQYPYALIEYIEAVLAHNGRANQFDFNLPVTHTSAQSPLNSSQEDFRLSNIIEAYTREIGGADGDSNFRDKRDSMNYLMEALGADFLIANVEYATVRKIKDMLVNTPKNRSKLAKTRSMTLPKQIEAQAKHGLEKLSATTVNKYLGYMSALFRWAKQNRYIQENPFDGVKVVKQKGVVVRRNFTKAEIAQILEGLSKVNTESALGKTRYWGAMLLLYTGARLNEIASLTVGDVITDENTGIVYIRITDDEESKRVKSKAAKRFVPIHPQLIKAGFLEYVAHAEIMVKKLSKKGGLTPRLLYALTYTNAQWGRKIGRWFNNNFLVDLGIKEKSCTLHSMRHSFITFLSAAGIEGAIIKSLVGHEPDTVTVGVYTHYGADHLPVFKEAMEKLPY